MTDEPGPSRGGLIRRLLVVVAAVLGVWLVGSLRAADVAQGYFAHAHGEGTVVLNSTVDRVVPAIPPFWLVSLSGDVAEGEGPDAPLYVSAMLLWVEPITGWTIVVGSG